MTLRPALYARVSTSRQEEQQTIASQLERLQAEAQRLHLSIPSDRQYLDDGVSGTRLARPGLDSLRDAVADGLVDLVFIASPDRLAREYVHQCVLLEDLQRHGARVHFVQHPVSDRPEDKLLVQMQGMFAEYERTLILERTRRGRQHKVRQGLIPPFSRAPYGYRLQKSPQHPHGEIVADGPRAQFVRDMYRWVLDESLSCRQVTRRLNERTIPAPRGARWSSSCVYKLLLSPIYAGQAVFGRREDVEPRRPRAGHYRRELKSSCRLRPEAQWIRVPAPALVTEAMQQEVRARFARNQLRSPRHTQHQYLLRTLVVCGQCGRRMKSRCSHRGEGVALTYACTWNALETGRDVRCRGGSVRVADLDELVWKSLKAWLQEPGMLALELEAWGQQQTQTAQAEQERSRWARTEQRLREQLRRLLDAYQLGVVPLADLQERRAALEAQRQECEQRMKGLEQQHTMQARWSEWAEHVERFAQTVRTGLDQLDFEGRQRLVRLLVERVIVAGTDVTIEHVVPFSGRFGHLRPPRSEAFNEEIAIPAAAPDARGSCVWCWIA